MTPGPVARTSMTEWLSRLAVALLIGLFSGCSGGEFRPQNLVKTDVNMVADLHLQQTNQLLRELTVKLYKRNPRELRKTPNVSIERRLQQLFQAVQPARTGELSGRAGLNALLLSVDPAFSGDRVFALMSGLTGMVHAAYGNREEFFMLSSLDAQALYNSARNIEILVWRLKHRVDAQGRPLILTDSRAGEAAYASYERLFGKMIALQDMMARIAADVTRRRINFVVHNVASAAFLPVGF